MHPPTPTPPSKHPNSTYPIGSEVEVTHKEDGLGGWFLATVVDPPAFLLDPSQHQLAHRVFVEYKRLLNLNGSGPLRGFVNLSNVRPKPPLLPISNDSFKENDVVDAFFDDGWWTGIINRILVSADQTKQYCVFFNNPPRWMQFSRCELRLHMFWIEGKWFLSSNGSIRVNLNPHKDSKNVIDLTGGDDSDVKDVSTNLVDLTGCNDSHLRNKGGELNVTSGTLVEVNFDSQDIWVPATFLKSNGEGFFMVEYYCSGKLGPVKVVVDSLHIRPTPPPSSKKRFNLLEKVDAFYDSCWLNAVVTQVLPEERYIVYCKNTKKEMEVHHKDVRPHVEWAGGKWVPSSLSQGCSPSLNPEKLDHACGDGYKDVHVSPEPTGVTKDNVGEQALSTITLKSWLMPSSVSQNADCDGAMPSNERSKGTSVNGDFICLMPSNQLKGKTITDVTVASKHCTVILEQSEVPNKRDLIDVLKYSSLQSKDGDQPSPLGNKDNCKRPSSGRKRGRPRKLMAFESEAIDEPPNGNDVVSPNRQSCMIRPFVKRRLRDINEILSYKEDKNELLRRTVLSGRQQRHCQLSDSLPKETANNGVAEVCDSGVAKDMGMVATRIPVNVSDDSSLGRPHCPPGTGIAGRCDETGEKQYKGNKQLTDQPVEKAIEIKDVESPVHFVCQDTNALHKLDETSMKSNTIVERNNKELPFVKNSHIWEMIESMEVFKRFPQWPHFRPLYEHKEELREGLAIGSMVTFTSLVDKVSAVKLSDPRNLLDGYLESLVDLERMGFNVRGVRDQLKSLVAIKDRHEETRKTYVGIEGSIMEQRFLKSRINEEISEVEEKIEELDQERSLLVGKKQMKDSAIQLLHAGVDDIKLSLRRAEQEFAEVAASPW